jgi:hypothetical protein
MVSTNPFLAFGVVILWIFGISLSTVKYLRAFRSGKKLDAWIWFFCWCFVIAFVEWFAFYGYVLIARIFGLNVEL